MKSIRKLLAVAAALILLFSALPVGAGHSDQRDASTTVLAFTSDVHNDTNDIAVNRLTSWINLVQSSRGEFEYLSFCGDMADADLYGDNFWNCAQTVFDAVDALGVPPIYTTGNHEHKNGYFNTTTNPCKDYYIVDAEGAEGANYRIYCLGTDNFDNEIDNYTPAQADALAEYLEGVDGERPIFVITHFPLHSYSNGNYWWSTKRQTVNANLIIDVLNDAVEDGKTIFFIWGHNHTLSDPYYDHLTMPGTTVPYTTSGSTKVFNFYYAAAGCMSDYEYSSGSQSVRGKGLVVELNSDNIFFEYYKEDGTGLTGGTVIPFNFIMPTDEPIPTPTPTPEPTPEPTEEPTPEPTEEPTPAPTDTPEPTAEPTPEPYLYGDVNGDGALSFTDVSKLYSVLLGCEVLPEEFVDRADFDRDEAITFSDVSSLCNHLLSA